MRNRIGPAHPSHPDHGCPADRDIGTCCGHRERLDRLRHALARLAAHLDDEGHHDLADRIRDRLHE